MSRLRILVWHIHGSYLNALAQIDHDWFLPVQPGRPEGYGGRGATFDLPSSMIEVDAASVRDLDLDLVLYQTPRNLREDGPRLLSATQRHLPRIYLEHNTPQPHAVTTTHPFADRHGLLVHVTPYNRLMWDNGATPTTTIEHSVAIDPSLRATFIRPRGIMVVNGPRRRPRIAGYDLFLQARQSVPLDIVGMETEQDGGFGDIPYRDLHALVAQYRFLYSPMRYTSLPLAVIEAMTLGLPIVALATTELPSVIENGVSGFVSNDPEELHERMRQLLADEALARRLGGNAREVARQRFGLDRFRRDWDGAFARAQRLVAAPLAAGEAA